MATIQEIGRKLSLSHTTVSKVLNGRNDQFISDATRARVHQAASEMGYRPNKAARTLATGRTHQIALWVRHLYSAYDAQVVSSLLIEIEKSGYQAVIRSAQQLHRGESDASVTDTSESNTSVLDALWSVDGCIVFEAMSRWFLPFYESDSAPHLPLVGMGGASFNSPNLPNMDYVGIDLRRGVEAAMRHLLEIGCQRIAFVGPYVRSWDEPRSGAYEAVLGNAKLPLEIIHTGEITRACVRGAVRDHIAARGAPDALLCFNDDVALGAYRAVRDLDLSVPGDVAIVGHDGIEDTEYLDTPITTLVQPVQEMCALAWQYLHARIENPNLAPQQTLLHSQLSLRASTQKR